MNTPPPRELHFLSASADDSSETAGEFEPRRESLPIEVWLIAALVAVAALNALRLLLS